MVLTIDARAQAELSRRVMGEGATGPRPPGIAEGAAVVDVRGGGVVALASSTGGNQSSDPGGNGRPTPSRPVASTVKPLLYAAAFGDRDGDLNQFSLSRTRPPATAHGHPQQLRHLSGPRRHRA